MNKYQLIEQIKHHKIEIADFTDLNFSNNDIDFLIDALKNNYSLRVLYINNNYNLEYCIKKHILIFEKNKFNKLYNILKKRQNLIYYIDYFIKKDNKYYYHFIKKSEYGFKKISIINRRPFSFNNDFLKYIDNPIEINIDDRLTNLYVNCNESIELLLKYNSIEKITIQNFKINDEKTMNNLIDFIEQNYYLNYICIENLLIDPNLFDLFYNLFFKSLQNKKYLKYLNISGPEWSKITLPKYIVNLLQINKNIKYLYLKYLNINEIDNLIDILSNYQLIHLTLTEINNLKIDHLIQLINSNEYLSSLQINTNLNNLYKLFDLLQTNTNLNELYIKQINFDQKSFDSFIKMIETNNSLVILQIDDCLTVNKINILLNSLLNNNTLSIIQCQPTYLITDEQLKIEYIHKLCNLIKNNKTLNKINIHSCMDFNIHHYGLIVDSLINNNTLVELLY